LLRQARRFEGGVLRSEAEDFVQEAFARFHENRKRYAPQNVAALLRNIVYHVCLKYVERAKAAKRRYQLTVHPDGWTDPYAADDRRYVGFSGFFVGHTPAEIDIDEPDAPLLAELPELREDPLDKFLSLRVHIAERGRDEHANGRPGGGHL
jgi:DNA-directed RNA polymerase specialized sigma24 family protein